jgi:hypothetical protein
MATTQFVPSAESNGTSNLTGLLAPHQQQALRLIMPRDMEKVFGLGIDIEIPSKGYTDPEWYFQSSDGCVWGIGWRWGQARLRGRGPGGLFENRPVPAQAAEFVDYIMGELA